MTYPEALAFLASLDRYGIKPGLERIARLCQLAGHPERRYPSILVAGTNGKGSTCAFLASILVSAGYRTGSSPKPDLYTPRERLQVDGQLCSEADFAALVAEIAPLIHAVAADAVAGPVTYFEAMTLMAFLWFARQRADWAVVEVGLGGRLDATNILEPEASGITNIGLDHMDRLGSTVEEIAAEKAGILRRSRPAMTGAAGPALAVIEGQAAALDAPLWRLNPLVESGASQRREGASAIPGPPRVESGASGTRVSGCRREGSGTLPAAPADAGTRSAGLQSDCAAGASTPLPAGAAEIRVSNIRVAESGSRFDLETPVASWRDLEIALPGEHQIANAALAAATVARLRVSGLRAEDDAIRAGLAATRIPGRLERLRERPLLLIDAAHNPDGARALASALRALYLRPGRRLILVLGLSEAHQPEEMATILAPLADRLIATASRHAQATPAARVAELARRALPEEACSVIESVSDAVAVALAIAAANDVVCVAGSIFVIAEVPRLSA